MTLPLTPEERALWRERYSPPSLVASSDIVIRLLDAYEALEKELAETRECPMIVCPFEEQNVKLRAEVEALRLKVGAR